jgi:GT2 family glycosyltransferase
MDLSVVTVNYKMREPLLECLESARREAAGVAFELAVVDNHSGDDSRVAVAERFPEARYVANDQNLGYARAVNQGLAATSGRYVLILNPDCVLQPGSIRALMQRLDGSPGAAVAGPKILDGDGTLQYSCRSFPDHFTFLFNRYSLLTLLFPRNRYSRRYLLLDWDHASTRVVDWVSGACMMVRRAAVERVGGMDEHFFMFNEDVDWCRRFQLAGYQVVYEPTAAVVHHIGASKSKVAPRVILERHRGMIHYFHKHHPAPAPLAWLADAFIMMRAGLMLAANALRWR